MRISNIFLRGLFKFIAICVALAMIGGAVLFIGAMLICGGSGDRSLLFAILVAVAGVVLFIYTIKNIGSAEPVKFNDSETAIINYIKLAQSQGLTDLQIKHKLRNEGQWSELEVAEAFRKSI
jgi:magnesium-transporting ATPase (P-type)